MVQPNEMPHSGQKHDSACSHQAEKEDHDERMLVVHKIVAQAGATVGDAAICESEVDPSKCRGDMNEEETVEEANGCVSRLVRDNLITCAQSRYLKAGSRPKKAMKVTRDTVTVKMMMVRATVMMGEGQIVIGVAWRSKEGRNSKITFASLSRCVVVYQVVCVQGIMGNRLKGLRGCCRHLTPRESSVTCERVSSQLN